MDYTTYTSYCPVVETKTLGGSVYTVTWTSTATIVTTKPTQVLTTTYLPDTTKTAEATAFTTITSLCPYYTTVTEGGKTLTKTLTSTETIVTKVPETIAKTVYTTSLTTAYKTTDVYVTETCPVVSYTTVIQGSTTVISETKTNYISVTKVYTTTVSCSLALAQIPRDQPALLTLLAGGHSVH